MLSLEEIDELEVSESYPEAIDALELRLAVQPEEEETAAAPGISGLAATEGRSES